MKSTRTRRPLGVGRRGSLVAAMALTTVVALFALAAPAPARPLGIVANPGPFTLTLTAGYIEIGDMTFDLTPDEFAECSDGEDNEHEWLWVDDELIDHGQDPECASGADNSELRDGFQPQLDTEIGGDIDRYGNVTIPKDSVNFPPAYMYRDGLMVVQIQATADGDGFLNPLTGDVEVNVSLMAAISGKMGVFNIPDGCSIGTANDPINVSLIDTVAYDQETGAATLFDDAFRVPATSGCGGVVGPIIDEVLDLPSETNSIEIVGLIDPIIKSTIRPSGPPTKVDFKDVFPCC